MSDWWKSPVLQGPENDYGDYDYLIEEVPASTEKWSWHTQKCGECGKEHRLNINYSDCFITMDGWDSIDYCECWKCYLHRKLILPFKKLKRKIKKCTDARQQVRVMAKDYKKIVGCALPKERQKNIYNILTREV